MYDVVCGLLRVFAFVLVEGTTREWKTVSAVPIDKSNCGVVPTSTVGLDRPPTVSVYLRAILQHLAYCVLSGGSQVVVGTPSRPGGRAACVVTALMIFVPQVTSNIGPLSAST